MSLIGSAGSADASIPTTSKLTVGNGPFVAYVENVKSGKIVVFAGSGATSFYDKALVNKLVTKAGE